MKLFYLMVSAIILTTNPLFAMDWPPENDQKLICLSVRQIRQLVLEGEPHTGWGYNPCLHYDVTINGRDFVMDFEWLGQSLIFGPEDKSNIPVVALKELYSNTEYRSYPNRCKLDDDEQIRFTPSDIGCTRYGALALYAGREQLFLSPLSFCNREKTLFKNHTKTYKVSVSYIRDLIEHGAQQEKGNDWLVYLKDHDRKEQPWLLSLGGAQFLLFSDDAPGLVPCSLSDVRQGKKIGRTFRLKGSEILSFSPHSPGMQFKEENLGLSLSSVSFW